MLVLHELMLLLSHDQELLVLRLKEPDPDREVQAHDPEFSLARESPIERVDNEDGGDVDMEQSQRGKHKLDIANAHDRGATVVVDIGAAGKDDERPKHGEDDESNTIAVEVVAAPIVATVVEHLHFDWEDDSAQPRGAGGSFLINCERKMED